MTTLLFFFFPALTTGDLVVAAGLPDEAYSSDRRTQIFSADQRGQVFSAVRRTQVFQAEDR